MSPTFTIRHGITDTILTSAKRKPFIRQSQAEEFARQLVRPYSINIVRHDADGSRHTVSFTVGSRVFKAEG